MDLFNQQIARQNAEEGIARAVGHANKVSEKWSVRVKKLFHQYLIQTPGEFFMEDFRVFAKGRIEDPPSNRAFGGVSRSFSHKGYITRIRIDKTTGITAHGANATVWQRTPKFIEECRNK